MAFLLTRLLEKGSSFQEPFASETGVVADPVEHYAGLVDAATGVVPADVGGAGAPSASEPPSAASTAGVVLDPFKARDRVV